MSTGTTDACDPMHPCEDFYTCVRHRIDAEEIRRRRQEEANRLVPCMICGDLVKFGHTEAEEIPPEDVAHARAYGEVIRPRRVCWDCLDDREPTA